MSGQLHEFAAGDRFWRLLRAVFGSHYKTQAAIELKRHWLERDFSQLPLIRVLAAEALSGANAVYVNRTNEIVLSRSFLRSASAALVNRVVMEEMGHYIDARINAKDTPGDEGERFVHALLGTALTPSEERRVATENDRSLLALAGRVERVEKAEPLILDVTTSADENDGSGTLGLGLSLRDAILTANNNPATDIEIRLAGGQTYPLRASGFHEDLARKGDLDIKARTGSLRVVATGEDKAIITADNLSIGDRIFDVLENANLSLSGLILSGGNCAGDGGAIHVDEGATLTILNGEIRDSRTLSDGGAIYNLGTCILERVQIHANKATVSFLSDAGGICNSGNLLLVNSSVADNIGEGIYNYETAILIGSTISGNSQQGIFLNGASAGLVNSTISGNQQPGIGSLDSVLTLTNCTLTENTSDDDDEGGGIHNSDSVIFLRNTIVAGNFNTDSGPLDLSGEFNGDANNLIGSLTGATGTIGNGSDIVTLNPGLAWLAPNGGATRTHALLATSPAINGGDNTLVALDDEDADQDGDFIEVIPFDGRGLGYERIRSGVVDIGAFESPIQPRGLPTVSLRLSPESLAEDGPGRFLASFTRTGSTAQDLTLTFTVSGSAVAGSDYGQLAPAAAAIKTATIAAGTNTTTVSIQPIADRGQEADETVALRLEPSSAYWVGTPAAVTGTIINDDFSGTASVDQLTGSIYSDTLDGLAGADVLTGREGADRFHFRASQSTLTAPDRITDFLINADKISLFAASGTKRPIPSAASRASDNRTARSLRDLAVSVFADANGALNGKQPLAAHQAALVVATQPAIAGTYLLANDATAGLDLSNDLMINITGVIGRLPAFGAFVPSTFFE
ncbi:MAG: choice-of-anchor Q domain-containing protein [Cyanobacteriota bacterium]|nr:choice-of-anchor Q domain-containing protein [Cyanobacteriota bacterium]